MTINDLAQNIYQEIGQPDDLSPMMISDWLSYNYGTLNILLHINLTLVDDEFSPELTIEQANIFKVLYCIKYFTGLISNNLGASAYDWSRLSEGDTSIQRVSKNEVAKSYIQIKSAYGAELNALVNLYKKNQVNPAIWY